MKRFLLIGALAFSSVLSGSAQGASPAESLALSQLEAAGTDEPGEIFKLLNEAAAEVGGTCQCANHTVFAAEPLEVA